MPHYDETFLEHCSRNERHARRSYCPMMAHKSTAAVSLRSDSSSSNAAAAEPADDSHPAHNNPKTKSWPHLQRRPFAPLKWLRSSTRSALATGHQQRHHQHGRNMPQLVHHYWLHQHHGTHEFLVTHQQVESTSSNFYMSFYICARYMFN